MSANTNHQSLTALFVDDNPDDHFVLDRVSRKVEPALQLYCVRDTASAQAYLRGDSQFSDRLRFPFPGLVLIDYDLATHRGTDLANWIRQHVEFNHLPIFVCSDDDSPSLIRSAYSAGADYCFRKPVFAEHLSRLFGCLATCAHSDPRTFDSFTKLPDYRPRW